MPLLSDPLVSFRSPRNTEHGICGSTLATPSHKGSIFNQSCLTKMCPSLTDPFSQCGLAAPNADTSYRRFSIIAFNEKTFLAPLPLPSRLSPHGHSFKPAPRLYITMYSYHELWPLLRYNRKEHHYWFQRMTIVLLLMRLVNVFGCRRGCPFAQGCGRKHPHAYPRHYLLGLLSISTDDI